MPFPPKNISISFKLLRSPNSGNVNMTKNNNVKYPPICLIIVLSDNISCTLQGNNSPK